MLRREFVRAVVVAGIAPRLLFSQQTATPAPPPPAPVPWTLGLSPRTPLPHTVVGDEIASAELRFFTPQQFATLNRLSDLLVPPVGDKPGALQADTPLFLDFLVGSSPNPRKDMYAQGLDWLQSESQKTYKTPFASLDKDKAGVLLKPWLRTWMNDHPPVEAHADFINIAHEDIRSATVNSKVWSDVTSKGAEQTTETALYWSPIEPDVYRDDFAPPKSPVIRAPKSSHTMPSYPQ